MHFLLLKIEKYDQSFNRNKFKIFNGILKFEFCNGFEVFEKIIKNLFSDPNFKSVQFKYFELRVQKYFEY